MKYYSEDMINEIVSGVDIVDYISQYVELKKERNRMFGLCPFHKEKTASFMVDESRKMYYCFGCRSHGNVIDFTRHLEGITFFEAVEKLSKYSGIELKESFTSETVKFLKKCKKTSLETPSHEILSPDILNRFQRQRIKLWEDEGISPEIIKQYKILYDTQSKRIVYPVYDNDGNLINVKGRTTIECWKDLKIPKYINYYKVGIMDYFQGLCFKKDAIREQNEVIVFEGIKSCMKAEGWGFHNVVSAETSALNIYQVKTLLRLHCNVVVAFDKDKSKESVIEAIGMLPKFTNVYVINDVQDLLGTKDEKNSPVDKGEAIWKELYRTKERVW